MIKGTEDSENSAGELVQSKQRSMENLVHGIEQPFEMAVEPPHFQHSSGEA